MARPGRQRSGTRPLASRTALSGAPPHRPIRSRAPSTRTAAGVRSGTPSATRRARSRTAATATAPMNTIHRYKEDVRLIRDLGVKAYRFSIAWPRVFPEGSGAPNPKGLDFYNRLLDELLANGIEPYATLYHWDLPQALQDRVGGWQSSETSRAFGDYAGYVAERLSDRVRNIFTLNEAGTVSELRLRLGHRCARPEAAIGRTEPGPPPRRAGARARGAGDPRQSARRHQGRPGREHRRLRAGVRHAGKRSRRRAGDAGTERGLSRRDPGGQVHRRVSGICRQGRPEIHRGRVEDHLLEKRFRRPQYLRAAVLHRRFRQQAGLVRAALPLLVPAHELRMAEDRPRGDLLGAAAGRKSLEHRHHLHQRERHLLGGQARRRRQGLRPRPHHVPAQLPRAAAARDRGGRAGARLFPVEPDGQFRMDLRLRETVRGLSRGFRDPGAGRQS